MLLGQFSNAMNLGLQKHRVLDLDGLRILDDEANSVHGPDGSNASSPRSHCKMHIGIVPFAVSESSRSYSPSFIPGLICPSSFIRKLLRQCRAGRKPNT